MKFIASFFVAALIGYAHSSLACSIQIDEEKMKTELLEKGVQELFNTKWKIEGSEITSKNISNFKIRSFGSSLNRYAHCGDYMQFEATLTMSIKRGSRSCQAVFDVLKTSGLFNGGVREEFFYSASEWPYCLN